MELVKKLSEIQENMDLIDHYLKGSSAELRAYAVKLIQSGRCFIVRNVHGQYHFYPSRFIGYCQNSKNAHEHNAERDGRVTNAAINKILHSEPQENPQLEHAFQKYCGSLGVTPHNHKHTFWAPI